MDQENEMSDGAQGADVNPLPGEVDPSAEDVVLAPVAEASAQEAPAVGEAEVYKDKFLRAAAELENFRKRAARERLLARRRERETLLREFATVLDNLERALDAGRGDANPWLEGIEAIRAQMLEVLKKHGASPFASLGDPFDPVRHEAVATIDLPEKPEATIADVVQAGYAMEDGTILRPARVIVVRHG